MDIFSHILMFLRNLNLFLRFIFYLFVCVFLYVYLLVCGGFLRFKIYILCENYSTQGNRLYVSFPNARLPTYVNPDTAVSRFFPFGIHHFTSTYPMYPGAQTKGDVRTSFIFLRQQQSRSGQLPCRDCIDRETCFREKDVYQKKTGTRKSYCFITNKQIDRWIDIQIALFFVKE